MTSCPVAITYVDLTGSEDDDVDRTGSEDDDVDRTGSEDDGTEELNKLSAKWSGSTSYNGHRK